MIKKNYSINLDIDIKSRLDEVSKSMGKSSSSIINGLILDYIESVKPSIKKEVLPEPEFTESDEQAFLDRMNKKNGLT